MMNPVAKECYYNDQIYKLSDVIGIITNIINGVGLNEKNYKSSLGKELVRKYSNYTTRNLKNAVIREHFLDTLVRKYLFEASDGILPGLRPTIYKDTGAEEMWLIYALANPNKMKGTNSEGTNEVCLKKNKWYIIGDFLHTNYSQPGC